MFISKIWPRMRQQHGGSCSAEGTSTSQGKCLAAFWIWKVLYKGWEDLDKGKVIWKMCKMEVKYCSNLLRPQPDTSQQRKLIVLMLPSTSLFARKITEAVTTFIWCKDIHPYSAVENNGLWRLVNKPRYISSSHNHFSEWHTWQAYRLCTTMHQIKRLAVQFTALVLWYFLSHLNKVFYFNSSISNLSILNSI